jgi:lysophospholipase L1-like esterase
MKKLLLIPVFFLLTGFTTFGDSITAGIGATTPAKSWVGLFTPVNKGISGAQAADLANTVILTAPIVTEKYTVMIGSNDIYKYRTDPIKQAYFKKFMRHNLAWLSFPNKVRAQDMVKTGTWWNASVNSFGIATSSNAATATATVTGTKVFIGHLMQDYVGTTGTASIEIDGVVVGTYSNNANGMTTHLAAGYALAACVFDVAAGTHTVKITVTSPNGGYFYLDYIAGNAQPSPKILLSNILKWSDAAYAGNGLMPTITNDYNTLVNQVIADFPNVVLVDNNSLINPVLHISDGVHPNDVGYKIIYNNFESKY